MIKKIVLITLFVLFAGALVAGGIYRTSAKSGYDISLGGEKLVEIAQNPDKGTPRNERAADSEEHQQGGERAGQGLGNRGAPQGRNAKTEEFAGESQGGQGRQGAGQRGQGQEANDQQGQGQRGQGQGQGNGRAGSAEGELEQEGQYGQGSQGSGQGRNQQAESAEVYESLVIEGVISQAPAAGVDMIIETADGQVLVGTGPGYLQEQGFNLAVGDAVQVSGYFEEDEFKAATITRMADGEAIALRDEFGRPMWSGAGRRASSGENLGGGNGQGNGQGSQGNGQTGI